MSFTVLDTFSIASGAVNEDRVGASGDRAWVIDGATDVLETPITPGPSDASWFANEVHELLADPQLELDGDLAALPERLAIIVSRRFRHARRRPPQNRFEHPSASGIVVRATGRRLDYVSVGDCTLIVRDGGGVRRLGADARDRGDRRLAGAIASFHAARTNASAEDVRRHVWPSIRATRNRMNTPGGYGVLSITPPPAEFVRTGTADLGRGAEILLASDGLMRLVDVYGVLSDEALVARARADGFAVLGQELRGIEAADDTNVRYPRAKTSDDVSGLLLTLE